MPDKQGENILEVYKKLTPMQCKVLDKLMRSAGKTNRQISKELCIEETTLEKHITRIGQIVGKRGRGNVKQWAIRQKRV